MFLNEIVDRHLAGPVFGISIREAFRKSEGSALVNDMIFMMSKM